MTTLPLRFALLLALFTTLSAVMTVAAKAAEQQTFVLVHGATAGAGNGSAVASF